MAQPTLIDFDVLDDGAVDSIPSKSFDFEAGDLIVVALRIYQADSNTVMTGANVTDSVNGAYTLRSHAQHFVGGDPERTDEYVFAFESSAAGTGAVTINPPGSSCYLTASVSVWRGGTFTYEGQVSTVNETASPIEANITAGVSGDYLMIGSGSFEAASSSGWSSDGTVLNTFHSSGFGHDISYRTFEGATALSIEWTGVSLSSIAEMGFAAAAWKFVASGPAATVDQEGFRFGLDDGSESAHGWKAAQDTNVTHPLDTNLLLRMILDAAGDPASLSPALRYQKNGSGGYIPVPVGATTTVYNSPGQPTSGTGTTIGAAADPWTINRPVAATGDLVVFVLAWDDSTTTSSVTPPSGPNGETAVSIAGPVASASTEMRMQAWYYIASAAWSSGTLSFDPSASETCRAVAFVAATAGNFNASDPIGWANTRASAGTAASTVNSPTGTTESDDLNGRMVIAYGSDADAITAPASGTTTVNNSTGGGVGLCVVTRNALAGNSESVSAIAASIASDSWASLAFVIKPDVDVVDNEVYVATSANIAAGGEATTARLTAPAGKTSGADFETGRRWDDENGTDAINPGEDKYTELEWCLRAQSPAVNTDYFDFRVYKGSSALDTYGVTPRWTVGSEPAGEGDLTLEPVEVAASGALVIAGAVDADSQPVEVAAAGAVVIAGDGAPVLEAVAVSASGAVVIAGDVAATTEPVAVAATAVMRIVGQVAAVAAAVVVAATGAVVGGGTAAVVTQPVEVAAAGRVAVVGAASPAVEPVEVAATGFERIVGAVDATTEPVEAAGLGALVVGATVDLTTEPVEVSAAGAVVVTAAGGLTTEPVTAAGAGRLLIRGNAAVTLFPVYAAGQAEPTGDVAVTCEPVACAASGRVVVTGAGASTAQPVQVSGLGAEIFAGDVASTTEAVAAAGAGAVVVPAVIGATLEPVAGAAAGRVAVAGMAPVTLRPVAVTIDGRLLIRGNVEATLQPVRAAAVDEGDAQQVSVLVSAVRRPGVVVSAVRKPGVTVSATRIGMVEVG